jgi:predicted outer membrane repeat protein
MQGRSIINNKAGIGGGVYDTIAISGDNIVSNKTPGIGGLGGGVDGYVTMTGGNISKNRSGGNGGGIYGSLTIFRGTILSVLLFP